MKLLGYFSLFTDVNNSGSTGGMREDRKEGQENGRKRIRREKIR